MYDPLRDKSVRFQREKEMNRRADLAWQLGEARAAGKQQRRAWFRAIPIGLARRTLAVLDLGRQSPASSKPGPGC
jgi:hypothetical protein